MQQRVAQARIHQPGFVARHGQFVEQVFATLQVAPRQPVARLAVELLLQKRMSVPVDCASLHRSPPEDGDPHFKVRGLLDQHMLLLWEEPKQIAAPNLIPART